MPGPEYRVEVSVVKLEDGWDTTVFATWETDTDLAQATMDAIVALQDYGYNQPQED